MWKIYEGSRVNMKVLTIFSLQQIHICFVASRFSFQFDWATCQKELSSKRWDVIVWDSVNALRNEKRGKEIGGKPWESEQKLIHKFNWLAEHKYIYTIYIASYIRHTPHVSHPKSAGKMATKTLCDYKTCIILLCFSCRIPSWAHIILCLSLILAPYISFSQPFWEAGNLPTK